MFRAGGGGRVGERLEEFGCLFFFLVLLQNDDETIWRLVVVGFAGREMGRWGDGRGELHGGVNDFLAVQRDVKDRLT